MVKKEAQKDWSEFTSSKVVEKCKEDDAKLVMRLQKPNGKVDVVINATAITDQQRAQIEDIVKRKTEVPADGIVITLLNLAE